MRPGRRPSHEEQQREKATDLRFLRLKIGQCPRDSDLALRPHQALSHSRLGHKERGGYFRRGRPAHGSKRERDLRRNLERRVANT